MAWRNLFRQKRRSLATLSALIIGLAGLVIFQGYLSQTMKEYKEETVRTGIGHIQLASSEKYFVDGEYNPYEFPLTNADSLITSLRSVPEVAAVFPSTGFTAIAGLGEKSVTLLVKGYPADRMFFGKEQLGDEQKFHFKPLKSGQGPSAATKGGLFLGETAARILGAKVGDVITLMAVLAEGGLNGQDFTVAGIYSAPGLDKMFAYTDYETAKEFTAITAPPVLHVILKDISQTYTVAARIHDAPVVKTWPELAVFFVQVNTMFVSFLSVIRMIILLITMFILANTMNRIVFERMREWGTLRAMGTKKHGILFLVITEGMLLGFIGAVIGIVIGLIAALGINLFFNGLPFVNGTEVYTIKITPDDQTIWNNLIPVTLTAGLAAFFPALRAVRMTPSECLRQI